MVLGKKHFKGATHQNISQTDLIVTGMRQLLIMVQILCCKCVQQAMPTGADAVISGAA